MKPGDKIKDLRLLQYGKEHTIYKVEVSHIVTDMGIMLTFDQFELLGSTKLNLPYRNAEPYDENDSTDIQYMQVEELNQFSGLDLPSQYNQVLRSAAGYYIGSLYYDKEMQGYYPYDRDSGCYWRIREEAEEAFISGNYPPHIY